MIYPPSILLGWFSTLPFLRQCKTHALVFAVSFIGSVVQLPGTRQAAQHPLLSSPQGGGCPDLPNVSFPGGTEASRGSVGGGGQAPANKRSPLTFARDWLNGHTRVQMGVQSVQNAPFFLGGGEQMWEYSDVVFFALRAQEPLYCHRNHSGWYPKGFLGPRGRNLFPFVICTNGVFPPLIFCLQVWALTTNLPTGKLAFVI